MGMGQTGIAMGTKSPKKKKMVGGGLSWVVTFCVLLNVCLVFGRWVQDLIKKLSLGVWQGFVP